MCGIVGYIVREDSRYSLTNLAGVGLSAVSNRGQDGVGAVILGPNITFEHKEHGGVREFIDQHFRGVEIHSGCFLGQTRYPTSRSISSIKNLQPARIILGEDLPSIQLIWNGNLTNFSRFQEVHRQIGFDCDTQMLASIIGTAFSREFALHADLRMATIAAVRKVFDECQGGFSCLMHVEGIGLVAFRDKFGIRPLSMYTDEESGVYGFASESRAFKGLEGNIDWVKNGEMVIISRHDFSIHREMIVEGASLMTCPMEWIYLASPESSINGVSVYDFRVELGRQTVIEWLQANSKIEIDDLLVVPRTSRVNATGMMPKLFAQYGENFLAHVNGIFVSSLAKRSFLWAHDHQRVQELGKHSIPTSLAGKRVMLVDDSIVRSNTAKKVVSLARQAGAREVHFVSCSPVIRHPDYTGIDIATYDQLVGHDRSLQEICDIIGADSVFYLSVEGLQEVALQFFPKETFPEGGINYSIFTGKYPYGVPSDYLATV